MSVPDNLCLTIDIPADLKVKAQIWGGNTLLLFNFEYNIVSFFTITEFGDGSNTKYDLMSTFALLEIKGGLAYYDNGWKVFDSAVQEKYAEYVVENEMLKDKNGK